MRAARNRKRSRAVAGVVHGLDCGVVFALEELESAVQVVGQQGDLEPVGIHHPAVGGMRRQTGVVAGCLNEVLRARTLIVEPDGKIDRVIEVGDEDAVDLPRGIEELVLFRIFVLFCPDIAQRQETVGLPPALGLIEEPALLVRVSQGRGLPVGRAAANRAEALASAYPHDIQKTRCATISLSR